MNPQWMIIAVEQDFYKNIDKLLQDNYKYVQCSLLCLIENVSSNQIPAALEMTKDSFNQFIQGQLKTDAFRSAGLKKVLQGSKRGAVHGLQRPLARPGGMHGAVKLT